MAKATSVNKTDNKASTSFSISKEHKELLNLICEKERRTKTAVMELLIEQEAKRLGIKLPKQ